MILEFLKSFFYANLVLIFHSFSGNIDEEALINNL